MHNINDKSNDNSLEIVENFIAYDERFKVLNQKKQGVVSARNLGIKKVKGDLLLFLMLMIYGTDFLKESIFSEINLITHLLLILLILDFPKKENINLLKLILQKIYYKNILKKKLSTFTYSYD